MLGFGRLVLQQAKEELRNGRLEEALRLLKDPSARGHKGVGALLAKVGRAYIDRGERKLRFDDVEGAWRDLIQAEDVGGTDNSAEQLRLALTRLGLAEIRALLHIGELGRAEEAIARLGARGGRAGEMNVLQEVVRGWEKARELAANGKFDRALESINRIQKLLVPPLEGLMEYKRRLESQRDALPLLLKRLHEASNDARWHEVIEICDDVLRLAPNQTDAQQARNRAWRAVEPATLPLRTSPIPKPVSRTGDRSPRYFLWIDGVGGYLICQGSRLSLGQAAFDAVDIPIIADISRFHATLCRDEEGYILEPLRSCEINGKATEKTLLRAGDRITLGECCQLHFHKPVPVSASARLDLVSGHRLPLALNGVLLMADTLILGAGAQAHVVIPELSKPIVLFRQKDETGLDEGVGIRFTGSMTINNEKTSGRAHLEDQSTIVSEEVTLALEPARFSMRTV